MSRKKPNRKRAVHFHFMATKEEADLIRTRMKSMGITSVGAYFRKMGIDGYFISLDLKDVRKLVSLLRYCSNNLNQYAKWANTTGEIYAADIRDLQIRLEEIWQQIRDIIAALSKLK